MITSTRSAITRRILNGIAAATLFLPLSAGAAADWNETQRLDINASSWNQVLFFDYETSDTSLSSVEYGDRTVSYTVRDGTFVGAFLFDYSEFQFTTGFYATTQSF